ncbi:hypothetical protein A2642_03415 [Candidatus Nomurabacteria bacterium RIFCSPHIGHO2_01_FULL_39_10]|uniref:Uncharacterized protein n=1 Tax=Candidatus Nomurabacteria bacterium RIFCSPHIGHO2_01_FULL_39_10 TaxID=1801733 RepID=A0A1F6V966_9BACT|nr:MAG: hypothetical protein A2642_03415 [Candidatus Nomurabacteria bacterium RIFCSPHIGHO2_01_FULL_39_10]
MELYKSTKSIISFIKKFKLYYHMETVTIPKREYEQLKQQAKIDLDILHQVVSSLKDIKEGRVRRVR